MTTVEPGARAQCPAFAVDRFSEILEVSRSRAVVSDPDVFAGNYKSPDENGNICAREYLDDILAFVGGATHRARRKMLNSLVRPEALENIRENIILPSFRRRMKSDVSASEDGLWRCDLAALVEKTFLEFTAKIIGLVGVETDEELSHLQSCVLPIFAGMTSQYFEERDAVTEQGMAAKKIFVERYVRPSRAAMAQLIERASAGEIDDADVPRNLMRLIVTEADPAYADEASAVRECILFFVATVGTSSQSVLHTIADLFRWFETHPDDYARRTDLDFVLRAFQESLRLKSSYISYNTRLAIDDIPVGDRTISKGQEIHLKLPLADRDTTVFGDDAWEFNPWREVSNDVARYGVAFGAGPHQCMGLRVVLGNDGAGGGHVRLVKMLLEAGVRPDPAGDPVILQMKLDEDSVEDVVSFITFPVIFTEWNSAPAA